MNLCNMYGRSINVLENFLSAETLHVRLEEKEKTKNKLKSIGFSRFSWQETGWHNYSAAKTNYHFWKKDDSENRTLTQRTEMQGQKGFFLGLKPNRICVTEFQNCMRLVSIFLPFSSILKWYIILFLFHRWMLAAYNMLL